MIPNVPTTSTPSTPRVLVAEDDELLRTAIRRTLENAGFEVDVVSDGQQALSSLSTDRFDVLVSDVCMPKSGGMDVLRQLRAAGLDVPVVLISGYSPDTSTMVEALDRGVLAYVPKPFRPDELARTVSDALGRHRASHNPRADALVALSYSLDRALASIELHRQPIVRWSQKTTLGWECLLRSREESLPHPGAIIGAAEQLDRLQELGRAVRRKCFEPGVEPTSTLFVNMHPQDLLDPDLYDAGSPLGWLSHRVVLEITERTQLEDIGDARRRVARLQEMGYRVAIDDIGAGFAALGSLTELQPDVIKLDMSLVRNVEASRMKQRLVHSLVCACDELNIVVVAEGVETGAELETLLDLGCDIFQGYLFARPGPGHPEPRWDVL